MLWKRRNAISTDTMAHEQHEVRDAYERGRRDERRARKRHPIMMSLTFAAALVGGVVLVLAAKEGSFARSGGIVDHSLAAATNRAEPVVMDAARDLKAKTFKETES
ncbi:hypothetical protein JKL49_02475 [Phenylobacterium sp. 20VBR1]|uniref:Uncharacterized protein n=1 Tax=Phenylobacterium glaciei TaxID=2803784 RepID=A0A941HVJ6_9CAUL|nr:hypothetical protein [Phenylobacterium glaciei]MBR7618242.1 hypothetical protein [Phenylobacterium glaciei]